MTETNKPEPQSLDDTYRSLFNILHARATMTEQMVFYLFRNFAATRPDPDAVLERMVQQLRDLKDEHYGAEHYGECRDTCEAFIGNLERTFRSAYRAY